MKKILLFFVIFAMLAGSASAAFDSLGFTSNDGALTMYGDAYVLYTDGDAGMDYLIDFDGTLSDLQFEWVGLYLVETIGVTPAELEAYYDARGVPEPFLTYLKEGANGVNPFAYINGGGLELDLPTAVHLYDAAKHDLIATDVPMTIPGDYPCGKYVVSTIDESVMFELIISGPECDADADGVTNILDKCLGTTTDVLLEELGTNRHVLYEDGFTTLVPAKKGLFTEVASPFSIVDTYGCSCTQILDSMSDTLDMDFGGHYKFGCSKSVMEEWIAGEYYVGPTFVETVEVPSDSATAIESLATLEVGNDYFLKAYGMANAGDTIDFDAKYSITNRIVGDTWTDIVSGYPSYGASLLDLFVDGVNVDWGLYNPEHTYQIPYAGTGNTLSLWIYDVAYYNNVGSLYVDIIEDKWVALW